MRADASAVSIVRQGDQRTGSSCMLNETTGQSLGCVDGLLSCAGRGDAIFAQGVLELLADSLGVVNGVCSRVA